MKIALADSMTFSAPSHALILLMVLALTALLIVAVLATWRSRVVSITEKVVLTLILVLAPGVGLVAWALFWALDMRRRPKSQRG
jgi:uncharacterized membrane protein YdbT with pleckstrin-like domain